MSNYLLDTHTAIWFFTDDPKLPIALDKIICDENNHIFLSIASTWELGIKINIGKLRFPGNAVGFMKAAIDNDITIIPIKTEQITIIETLPLIHRNPFDRLLIAAAITENMTLITDDSDIALYDVKHIW